MKRIVVLASGRGSNFKAVLEATIAKQIDGQIHALITDRKDTGAEEIATEFGIPVVVFSFNEYKDRNAFDEDLQNEIDRLNPDLILTLGYMRILSQKLVKKYNHRMINIHPSLLPAFPGMNSQRKAWDYGTKVTGATVHFLDEGVDTGPIILQRAVSVAEASNLEELTGLILNEEHTILVEAVKLFCNNSLRIDGRHVYIERY